MDLDSKDTRTQGYRILGMWKATLKKQDLSEMF